jgi:hypothetical protein
VYDAGQLGWGERGDAVYFNNPMDYVANLTATTSSGCGAGSLLLLVCGQGQWEDTTGALESTKAFDRLLARRASATRPTCGATTSPTTGPPGGPSSPTTCHGSSERWDPPAVRGRVLQQTDGLAWL